MTTIEQYAQQIRDLMTCYPKRPQSDATLATIQTAVVTGGTLAEVERILAADELLRRAAATARH